MKRRTFLATAVAMPMIFRSSVFGAGKKLNIAYIGMGGQIQGHVSTALNLGHNVVAFCDVDPNQIAKSKARHGAQAGGTIKEYADYRQMIEKEKTLDAVVIATPDHWHSTICKAVMKAGLHVFCEKPLTRTIAESRELREISRRSKVVTQTGNHGSASPNLRRSIELIQAGLFGSISNVHIWHPSHGWPCGMARPEGEDAVPQGMNWDFWCGPAPLRPYKDKIYHPEKWRGWYDFGNGSIGDFCCHSFNMPVRALKLGYPTRVEISDVKGAGMESYAKSVTHTFHFSAEGDRAAVNLIYYTGGENMPPARITDSLVATFGGVGRTGAIVEGEHGLLCAGLWNDQCYIKMNDDKKFIGHEKHAEASKVPQSLPRVPGHLQEWTDAIIEGGKTFAPFELGGHLTEIGLAGNIALRLQRNLDWDGEAMKAKGVPEADALVRQPNRTKWM